MVWFVPLLLLAVVVCGGAGGEVPGLPDGEVAGYLSFDQALQYARDLHKAAPELVSDLTEVGKSVEGRPLVVFCVGHCTEEAGKALFTALHHSREVGIAAKRGCNALAVSLCFPPPLCSQWD